MENYRALFQPVLSRNFFTRIFSRYEKQQGCFFVSIFLRKTFPFSNIVRVSHEKIIAHESLISEKSFVKTMEEGENWLAVKKEVNEGNFLNWDFRHFVVDFSSYFS